MINGPENLVNLDEPFTCAVMLHVYIYCPYDNDITNQLLNVLPCNMHVVHPWWECYPRLTPRVTLPPRMNNIACYMAEHLALDNYLAVVGLTLSE